MSFISKTIAWLGKEIKIIGHDAVVVATEVKVDVAPLIVGVTGGIQTALNSGILGSISGVLESIFPVLGTLPDALIAETKKLTPKLLAVGLAIEGLPDNPTKEEVLAFEKRVMNAFAIVSDTSKFYTTFAADMYGEIQKYSADTTPKTFAKRVILIESIFEDYKVDVLDAQKAA